MASATPVDAALQRQLLGVYDSYGKALVAGRLSDAAQLRTAKPRAEMLALAKKPKREQADMLGMARSMTPDEVTPVHANLADNGQTATIETVVSKTWPAGVNLPNAPKPGTVTHGEVSLKFAKEGGAWKLLDQSFGPDPASIVACQDEPTETEVAYDLGSSTNVGGQIRRVDFKPDHTLVVIRILDEENCLILPSRSRLNHPDKLVPWALIDFDGAPHRSDKRRFLAEKWTVTDED